MSYNIFIKSIFCYFVLGIIVASFIGSIVSIIWLLFSKRATKFYIIDSMKYLKLIMMSFVLPAIPFWVYPVCKMIRRGSYINLNNPMFDKLVILIGIWLFFIVLVLAYRFFHYCRICRISGESVPIQDEDILLKLENWKDGLGIQKDVSISYNAHISSPAILYYKGYRILFPTFAMTERQMEIALLHELVHLKNKDTITKDVCFFVQLLHGWNPFAYMLKNSIVRWAEVLCDLKACELGEEIFTAKEYYNTILEMMKQAQEETHDDVMFCLFEKESLIRFRIDKYKLAKQEKTYRANRCFAMASALVCGLTLLVSSITVQGLYVWYEDSLIGFEKETQKEEVRIKKRDDSVFINVSKMYRDTHDFAQALDEKRILDKNEVWEIQAKSSNIEDIDVFIFTESQSYVIGYRTEGGMNYFDGTKTASYSFDDKIKSIIIKNCGEKEEFDIAANTRK